MFLVSPWSASKAVLSSVSSMMAFSCSDGFIKGPEFPRCPRNFVQLERFYRRDSRHFVRRESDEQNFEQFQLLQLPQTVRNLVAHRLEADGHPADYAILEQH